VLGWLLDLLSPRECAACAESARSGVCFDCRKALVPPPALEIDRVPVIAASEYRAPIDRAIHRFKYGSRPDLAGTLAALVPSPAIDDRRSLVVPVPLHPTRLVERGYNQSALLAERLATRFGLDWSPRALERVVATDRQATLRLRDRTKNVDGVFAVRPSANIEGRHVLLVDDVVTTGATARGCIEALRRSGARPILVLSLAMTVNPGRSVHENC
jgi:ComF family protein